MINNEKISLRLPAGYVTLIINKAKKSNISFCEVIRRALRKYFNIKGE